MSFSLKKLAKKSIKFVAASLVAIVLSGISIHTHQSTTQIEHANKSTISFSTQITGMAYAEGEDKSAATTDADAFTMSAVKFLNMIIAVMYAILIPLISLAGWLLSPDWVMGDIFNLRPVFHNLWILVSNVVYVIFAFILIAMAFMNIFGSGNKAYEIKSALPKLIVGIMMVPLTWFIVSGTLSVTSILTASVLQLPSKVIEGTPGANYLDDIYVPNAVYVNFTSTGAGYGTGNVDNNGTEKQSTNDDYLNYKANGFMYSLDCSKEIQTEVGDDGKTEVAGGDKCVNVKEMLTGNGAYSVLFAYAYGIFNVQNFQKLSDEEIGKLIKNVGDVAIKLMFGVIVFLAFGFMVIALIVALFMRAIHLWLFAIFSPIFALWHFFDGKVPGLEKMKTVKLTIGEFFGLAMVPVVVSAGLAFGLMFLSFTMRADIDNAKGSVWNMDTKDWQSTFSVGGFKLVSIGTINPEKTDDATAQKAENVMKSLPGTGKSLIGKIIINLLALVLLWMIVQAALSTSEVTKKVVEPIFKFGQDMAKAAPILPKGMGGSIGGMEQATQVLHGIPREIQTQQLKDSWLADRTRSAFGLHTTNLDKIAEEVRWKWSTPPAASANVRKLLQAQTDFVEAANTTLWINTLDEQLKKMWVQDDKRNALIEAYKRKDRGAAGVAWKDINDNVLVDWKRVVTWSDAKLGSVTDIDQITERVRQSSTSTPPATPAAPGTAAAWATAATAVIISSTKDPTNGKKVDIKLNVKAKDKDETHEHVAHVTGTKGAVTIEEQSKLETKLTEAWLSRDDIKTKIEEIKAEAEKILPEKKL